MNLGAYETAKTIEDKVRGWARMAGAEVDKGSLAKTLEHWHIKFIGNALMTNHDGHTKILRGWAAQIVATLDPPKEKDLPDQCPSCGAGEWWRDGERFQRPLIIRYRPADSGVVKDATGMCRACAMVWGARELAYELEITEAQRLA